MPLLRKIGFGAATGMLLLAITACGTENAPTLSDVQNGLESAIADAATWAGEQVGSLDGVNERVTAATKDLVGLFGELDYNLGFRENGISFTSANGVDGVVGIEGNSLVLDVAYPGNQADAMHTVNRILTLFSENSWAEDRLTAVTNSSEPQTVQLNNGWIETDGETVNVHLRKPLI